MAVAASPELVDLLCRVTSGDGGVGPVGGLQRVGEDDLARGVQDVADGVVGGRGERGGHGLVGDAAHDVRVRALVTVEFLHLVRRVVRQAEAEPPVLGAVVWPLPWSSTGQTTRSSGIHRWA